MGLILKAHLSMVVTLLLCCAGCGGSALQKAKGQILVGGKNYQVGAQEQLLVIFYPDVPSPGVTYPAEVKPDGSFETVGLEGNGIPPGKYRVSVSNMGRLSVTIPPELGQPTSPVVREVLQGKETLDPIDITRPAG